MTTENEAMGASSSASAAPFEPYTMAPQVEKLLEEHLGQSAKVLMPEQWRENFARYFPWVTLLLMPVHFASVMLLFGLTALASLVGHFSWTGALLSAAVLVCDVIALPGLFSRARRGWAFFVYAQLISIVSDLISVSAIGLLLGVVILWIAFQVKPKYT